MYVGLKLKLKQLNKYTVSRKYNENCGKKVTHKVNVSLKISSMETFLHILYASHKIEHILLLTIKIILIKPDK